MRALVVRFVREEDGQDLIEYALLAAFIALACVLAITGVGTGITGLFGSVKAKLDAAAGAP
jgi:pilus assembly protein Flp/PilA